MNVRFVKLAIALAVIIAAIPVVMTEKSYAVEVQDEIVTETKILYSDVDESHWAYETILDLTNRDIVHGYKDGEFKPDEIVTRVEFAKILANVAELSVVDLGVSAFDDVDASSVMSPYVEAVRPYLGKWRNTETGEMLFMPNKNVKRSDLITTVLKMRGVDTTGIDTEVFDLFFTDADKISDKQKPYITYAIKEGYIGGFSDRTFRGDDFVTRAQLCVILDRVFKNPMKEYVADYTIMNYNPPKEPEVPKYSYTAEDLEILARIMYCEAGSYWITDEQQLMFGNVVLNRVTSPEFPNTVRGVAYQKGQYAPHLFNKYTVDQRTYNNAKKLLEGYRCMPESVVFQANFRQGSGIWKAVQIPHLGTTYFCYSNRMSLYQ